MTPVKEHHKNDIYWRLHIWLPVNAVLRGQNYLLGEHTDIPFILHTLAKFIRLFLLHFGFTPSEVQYFIDTARLEDMEPSYHVSCSSPKAAANAQKRLLRHLECLAPLRLAHYRLWKVKVMRTNKAMTTYAHVDRAMLRTYLKALLARPTERACGPLWPQTFASSRFWSAECCSNTALTIPASLTPKRCSSPSKTCSRKLA